MPKYVVTNGRSYLRMLGQKGGYGLSPKADATIWNTRKQALNALNNGVSRELRGLFYVEKTDAKNEIEVNKLIEADMTDFNRWLSDIGNFPKFIGSLDTEKKQLMAEMQSVEQEICDIRHYIEFSKLNAYQGWVAYEMMRQTLIQRRKICDVIYIIHRIQSRDTNISVLDSVKSAIYNLNRRVYAPRKLDVLFEGTLHYSVN